MDGEAEAVLETPLAFKFEPRSLVFTPSAFGKTTARQSPRTGIDQQDPRFSAAQFQHEIANAVREGILVTGKSLDGFVKELSPAPPGFTYDRLVRILRGETLMQVADLIVWAQRFPAVRHLLLSDETWPQ